MDRRRSSYSHPPAWRGVASPGYLYHSHWQALAEELGGLRCPPTPLSGLGEGGVPNPFSSEGLENMAVLSEVGATESIAELREFVLERLERHERLVLTLVYAERLSLGEVALVLGLPEATVREVFVNTIATLRERFSKSC